MSLASGALHNMDDLRRQDCQACLKIFLSRATFSNEWLDFKKNDKLHQKISFFQKNDVKKVIFQKI